jgi:DNA-binding GntR family transcriptional regulator
LPDRSQKIQPLYEWVRLTIERRIASGKYSADNPIPAVLTLAAQLGVSAITVRRALRDLQHAGVLRVVPGLGTFINTRPRFLRNLNRSKYPLYGVLDDPDHLGRNVGIQFRSVELINPTIPEFQVFEISEGQHFCVKKLIVINGGPIAFDSSLVSFPADQDLLEDFSQDFIYNVLRKRKMPVVKTNMYFDAAPASGEVANEFGIPRGYPTIRHFYNPVLRGSATRIYGVSISPFDRLGFTISQPKRN